MTCNHVWMTVHEQFLLGGTFVIGYQCELCGQYAEQNRLTPQGFGGTMSTKQILIGPHGCNIDSADGRMSRKQVYDTATGKLEYIE